MREAIPDEGRAAGFGQSLPQPKQQPAFRQESGMREAIPDEGRAAGFGQSCRLWAERASAKAAASFQAGILNARGDS